MFSQRSYIRFLQEFECYSCFRTFRANLLFFFFEKGKGTPPTITCPVYTIKGLEEKDSMKGRCSCPGVFCKKGVLKNFTKCTGKDLSRSLFYRVTDLQPRTLSNSGICVFIRTSQKFSGQVFQLLEERWNLLQTVPIAITNNNSKLSKAVYILCFLRSTLGRFQRRT